MLRKSTNLIIDPVIISSTDVGAEVCFDPVGLYIFFRFQTGLFRIKERVYFSRNLQSFLGS